LTLRFCPEQIEQWPVARLKPYARNARTHSEDQVAKIAASLVEYGCYAESMIMWSLRRAVENSVFFADC
jgi:hypothetical protein